MKLKEITLTVIPALKRVPFHLLIGISLLLAVSHPVFMRLMEPTFVASSGLTQWFLLVFALFYGLVASACAIFLMCVLVGTLKAIVARYFHRGDSDKHTRACAFGVVAIVGLLAVACGPSEAEIAERVEVAVEATRAADPTATPAPVPPPPNWRIVPDNKGMTLVTTNLLSSKIEGAGFELWSLLLTCTIQGDSGLVHFQRFAGNPYLGEDLEEIVELQVAVDVDGVPWADTWLLDQTRPGSNGMFPIYPGAFINMLLNTEALGVTPDNGNEDGTTLTFLVGGLSHFIDGPDDLCE